MPAWIFKVWDPKDPEERLVACGRYISDVFDGVALHPVDLIDVVRGEVVAEMVDVNMQTIAPVVAFHPSMDMLAAGSSGSLYLWEAGSRSEAVDRATGSLGIPLGGSGSLARGGSKGGSTQSKSKKASKVKRATVNDNDSCEELDVGRSRGRGKGAAATQDDQLQEAIRLYAVCLHGHTFI